MFTQLILTRHDVRLDRQTGIDVPITQFWDVAFHSELVNHGKLARIPIKDVPGLLARFPEAQICVPDHYGQEWLMRKGFHNLSVR